MTLPWQDVDLAELGEDVGDGKVHLGALGQIGRQRQRLEPRGLDLARHRGGVVAEDVQHCDLRAFLREPQRDGPADAAAAAGYERRLAL